MTATSTSTISKSAAVTLCREPIETIDSVISIRPALLVRLAEFGAHVCIGVITDRCDPCEESIIFGTGTAAQVASLEAYFARPLRLALDAGVDVQATLRTSRWGNISQLLWLQETRRDPNSKSWQQDLACFPPAMRHGMAMHAAQQRDRREKILAMRRSWSIGDARTKSDAPGWLPKAALGLLIDGSAYRSLPESTDENSSAPARARR